MQEKTGFKKLTKEEIGYKTTDKIRQMWLLNPHDHHFLYVRDDGSFYGFTHMKGEDPEEWFWEPDGIQTELFPPAPPKSNPPTEEQIARAPHLNMLEKYYGKDWKVEPVEGLEDHY